MFNEIESGEAFDGPHMTIEVPKPKYANYPGDVTHIIGESMGPGNNGKMWVATDATYDPDTNKTRVEFDEVTPRA